MGDLVFRGLETVLEVASMLRNVKPLFFRTPLIDSVDA